ncbi:FAD-dependent monooxygenase [Corynebacterium lowii]|uniref:Pentachlorophenol 4-monooxygenase n=1 Tax=Corynebacterium lowii TaxID=1544413 RepID=A0A0Q1E138_9CORY|nr:FAD-dependent monooxygenase [Corynebacterium lowii]KQB86177.1 Pentachlorophenol 4-monooxygenase [Corynebacterium lowii]MDP9852651.1 2-polyprenyl-6-methoxyphenol hydroxylase-like FAD-dependent oxidoreductase [Corynebacterium lowii]
MNTHDVLIVGAGPAGLTLACDLQRRGVEYLLIDAAAHSFEGSRAKGIQPRSLEVFDDLGVRGRIESAGTLYPTLGLHFGPVTIPRRMMEVHEPTSDIPHPNTLLVPQYATDAALASRLEELGGSVERSTRLLGYSQDAEGVTAEVEGPEGTRQIRARYIVGADGGSSAVRKQTGIGFTGTTDESDRMIVADLSLTGLSDKHWHIWPRLRGHFMALCPLPDGKFQLMYKIRPEDEVTMSAAHLEERIHAYSGTSKIHVSEVHWSSVWRPNIRLADQYRKDRAFLIGDAAHVHPPTGAQGLNTGTQDAYNLGWKLAQVLAGAPDALLDTYEAERRPVAAGVLGLAAKLYGETSTNPIASMSRGDQERQLTLTYRGGPLAPAAEGERVRPGDRAPDAPYTATDGSTGTLFDALRGPHFTLLTIGDAYRPTWPNEGAELRILHLDPARNQELCRTYGVTEPTAQILIRPDGYVASDDVLSTMLPHA